jgi:hypothetical protein
VFLAGGYGGYDYYGTGYGNYNYGGYDYSGYNYGNYGKVLLFVSCVFYLFISGLSQISGIFYYFVRSCTFFLSIAM